MLLLCGVGFLFAFSREYPKKNPYFVVVCKQYFSLQCITTKNSIKWCKRKAIGSSAYKTGNCCFIKKCVCVCVCVHFNAYTCHLGFVIFQFNCLLFLAVINNVDNQPAVVSKYCEQGYEPTIFKAVLSQEIKCGFVMLLPLIFFFFALKKIFPLFWYYFNAQFYSIDHKL